jgi:hypothetical protein
MEDRWDWIKIWQKDWCISIREYERWYFCESKGVWLQISHLYGRSFYFHSKHPVIQMIIIIDCSLWKVVEDICRNIVRFDRQLHQHVSYEGDVAHQLRSLQTANKKNNFFQVRNRFGFITDIGIVLFECIKWSWISWPLRSNRSNKKDRGFYTCNSISSNIFREWNKWSLWWKEKYERIE